MIISSITITAEASKSYQKYCVSLTGNEIDTTNDIDTLKNFAISEAVKGINELAGQIDVKPEVKTTVQTNNQPRYMNNGNSYRQPVQQNNTQNNTGYKPVQNFGNSPRMASENQMNYLRSLGYQGETNITFEQADTILKQLKSQQ